MYTHTHMYAGTHTHSCTCMHTHTLMHMHAHTHTCMHAVITHACTCTHIHTHTHTHITINGLIKSICQGPSCIITILRILIQFKVQWWYTKMSFFLSKVLPTILQQNNQFQISVHTIVLQCMQCKVQASREGGSLCQCLWSC